MVVKATVTEIYDMNTHLGKIGLIGIHTPETDLLFKHLFGLFTQFKRWKYNGARFSLVPAAQLPQDIAGVSIEGGDQAVDPRDIFNPILHKGFTGESLGSFLDNYLDPSMGRGPSLDYNYDPGDALTTEAHQTAYYQMLTQGGFRKMPPMGGIRSQYVYPMVYDVATTRQLSASWNGAFAKVDGVRTLQSPMDEIREVVDADDYEVNDLSPSMRPTSNVYNGQHRDLIVGTSRYGPNGEVSYSSSAFGIEPSFITPRKSKLGWMDTLQKILPAVDGSALSTDQGSQPYTFAQLPKLYEYLIVTPPSYYTKLYYRLVLQHEVLFSGLRSATGASNAIPSADVEYNNYMEQLPGDSTSYSASVDVLGGEVTPVTDGMAGSII